MFLLPCVAAVKAVLQLLALYTPLAGVAAVQEVC